jgi:hypothetical protein
MTVAFNADEALKGGLVRSAHAPQPELMAASRIGPRDRGQHSTGAIAWTRAMLWWLAAERPDGSSNRQYDLPLPRAGRMMPQKEGISSLEKRSPVYPDKVSADPA